jgi:hypothetical protein
MAHDNGKRRKNDFSHEQPERELLPIVLRKLLESFRQSDI